MHIEPITAAPKDIFPAIGVGMTKGYELLNSGDIESVKIGRARRVIVASARAYIARLASEQRQAA